MEKQISSRKKIRGEEECEAKEHYFSSCVFKFFKLCIRTYCIIKNLPGLSPEFLAELLKPLEIADLMEVSVIQEPTDHT